VNNLEVELRIVLPDQTERPVKVEKSYQTQDVCKVSLLLFLCGQKTNERNKVNLSNGQFQLLVYACRGRWEVRYHIADYAEKIEMVAV
jgi:hypothetical protein